MAVDYNQMVEDAYAQIGRTGFGTAPNQIDQEGFNYWTDRAAKENLSGDQFQDLFGDAVGNYFSEKPNDRYTNYVTDFLVRDQYDDLGRTGIGDQPNQIDQQGYDYWRDQLVSGGLSPSDFESQFDAAAQNALNVPSAQSQTPAATKDYVINYLRNNPTQTVRTPDQLAASGGIASSSGYLGQPVSYGGNNYQMMNTGGDYASDLIEALRSQSNERFSNNPGVYRMATTQPNSGALQPLDPNRESSIFNPERNQLTPYDPATDPRRIQVTDLYRQVLKRDPDQPGLDSFANSKMTIDQIREAMLKSPEYQLMTATGGAGQVARMASTSQP